ncbi:MAG: hypothetical protein Q8K89_09390 [Actinomycetota bacterium]|nr:hypothetical protein [Actinomycetota bacterium]
MNGHVHYGLTKRWAIEQGYDPAVAEVIAAADIRVDREFPGRAWRNKRYHFAWLGARRIARKWLAQAMRDGDPALLGQALHCEQDAISHGQLGHLIHWPGIDLWERRGPRVRARIESATRAMLAEYMEATGGRAETLGDSLPASLEADKDIL